MAQTFRDFVYEILRHERIKRINFQYGPLRVYPQGYATIAEAVRTGRIRFVRAGASGNASYEVDTAPGTVHNFAVPTHMIDTSGTGTELRAKSGASASDIGTMVHEATHALQDYQRHGDSLSPRMAEGGAYLAGWMARLLWGEQPLPAAANARSNGHTFARHLAGRLLGGGIVYQVPDSDVRTLNSLVSTGAASRYVFNGL